MELVTLNRVLETPVGGRSCGSPSGTTPQQGLAPAPPSCPILTSREDCGCVPLRGPHLEPAPASALAHTGAAPAASQDASGLLLISCRAFLTPGPGSTSLHRLP